MTTWLGISKRESQLHSLVRDFIANAKEKLKRALGVTRRLFLALQTLFTMMLLNCKKIVFSKTNNKIHATLMVSYLKNKIQLATVNWY